jgi:hypothetical protein
MKVMIALGADHFVISAVEDPDTFVDQYRTPHHTEKLHVIERWHKIDGGKRMEVEVTARIYFVTQRDGVGYNLAYIDKKFTTQHPDERFDKAYMNALFNYAEEQSKNGYAWRKIAPILVAPEPKQ